MGKVKDMLSHPDELLPLLSVYMAARRAQVLPKEPGLAFCYDMLNRVSRSFAVVIQQLPDRLRDAVCVFYLVLRALDTVEDDMALDDAVKLPLLRCFHKKSYDPTWSMECGTGHYKDLMAQYPLVTQVFLGLEAQYQAVIADICDKMGNGMADFIPQEVKTVEQYDLYCHYVAGLVGIGLSQLFASSGLESPEFAAAESLSNEMGLFLQKTNIIRDYLEDINEEPAPRMFWPKEIWGGYARRLADFKQDRHADASVACLNHMILDALRHAEGSLEYMSRLRSRPIFRFCAIPQVMAIGTLARCFANRGVFTGVVKMRRGETAKIMWLLDDYADACGMFRAYARQIAAAAATGPADPATTPGVLAACARLEAAAMARIRAAAERGSAAALAASVAPISLVSRVVMVLLAALYVWAAWHADEVRALAGLPHGAAPASMDALHRGVAALVLGWVVAVAAGGRRIRA